MASIQERVIMARVWHTVLHIGIQRLASVRLWKFKDGGSLKARFLQCGDQVSRISLDFLKWRSMGPQKLATLVQ